MPEMKIRGGSLKAVITMSLTENTNGIIIDFHSHVLPGIDDGSRSIETSREMLKKTAESGISVLAATPHFYASHTDAERFPQKRKQAFESLLPAAQELGITLLCGAEAAYFRHISEADVTEKLVIAGTNVLLVEMPFGRWDGKMLAELENLRKNGIIPMIAHLNRYVRIRENKDYIAGLLEDGYPIQLNAEAFTEFGKRGMLKLLKEYDGVVLGSDCHNTSSRPQFLGEARKVISEKLGKEALKKIDDFGADLVLKQFK